MEPGGWVSVVTVRGAVEARAMVTRRIRPVRMGGDGEERTVHQVAIPFHWGSAGPLKGDVANDLVPLSGEPNVTIHESKALLCNVLPGRRAADEGFLPWLEEQTRRREEEADEDEDDGAAAEEEVAARGGRAG